MSLRLRKNVLSPLLFLSVMATGLSVSYGQSLAQNTSMTPAGLRPENIALQPATRAAPAKPVPRTRARTSRDRRSPRKIVRRPAKAATASKKSKNSPRQSGKVTPLPKTEPKRRLRAPAKTVAPPPPSPVTKTSQPTPPQPAPAVPSSGIHPVAGQLPSNWQATVLDHPSSAPNIPLPPPPAPGLFGPQARPPSSPQQGGGQSGTKFSGQYVPPATIPSSHDRVLLPISTAMGVAAYRSGTNFIVVLDNSKPLDTSALHGDGIFSNLSVENVPGATIIKLPLPDTRQIFLSHQDEGWVVGDQPPPGNYYNERHVITPRIFSDGLLYPMRRPGRVLTLDDPISHERLLVGTTQLDDGGILDLRKGAGYDVWPSLEGVVVPVYSPSIGMRATPYGPLLTNTEGPLSDLYKGVYANKVDQDWLGLQKLPLISLQKRFYDDFIAAVDSQPGDRFNRRLQEAKSAFAIGAFIEARGILTVALEDDPEEGLRPDVGFLLSASELLSGRPHDAFLLDGVWPDDAKRATQLWRGIYQMHQPGKESESAHILAQDFARLENYPSPVREVIEPRVAEQIARYGHDEDLPVLAHLPSGDGYDLARAFIALRTKHRPEALRIFGVLAYSRDPIIAEKAYEQKTLLDMSDGTLTPLAAAGKFASLIPDARLAGREVTVRLLQANAYMRAKKWGAALTALDLAQDSPEHESEPMLGVMLFQTLAEIAHGAGDGNVKDSALRNAAMLRGHLAMIPQGNMKGEILVAYGRMLLDLGLFNEAHMAFSTALPMLDRQKEMHTLAAIGLANAYLAEDNLPQARAVLNEADSPQMTPQMQEVKRRMAAHIAYKAGQPAQALYLLKNDMSDDSLDFRARIHESRGEWRRAVAVVRRMVETTIPPQGKLTSSQQLLALRLASDASSANDRGTLIWLTQLVGSRETQGESGRVFQLLTHNIPGNAPPVH